MKYYLLKFKKDWADEFDCEGFSIINQIQYEALDALFNSSYGKKDVSWFFGTNEGWEEEFTYSELWNEILVREEIDEFEMKVIRQRLLSYNKMSGISYRDSYGIFLDLDYLADDLDQEEIDEIPELKNYLELLDNGIFVI